MDIRKFFGAVAPGNKHQHDAAEKNVKPINKRSPSGEKSKLKEIKVKNPSCERDSKQKLENKKKRIIYDSDSEEEIPIVKRSKKQPDGKPSTKPDKILRKDPVVYVSETDEDEDFVNKKVPPKHKENGASASSHVGIPGTSKEDSKPKIKNKPLSPVKLTPTSVIDYFGTSTVQRSEKKLVSSKRKECSQNRDPTLSDEAIAKKLQIEENIELERQLHEDEEFARTLAMLDEAPKRKKPRKDAEEKQIPSTAKTSPKDTDKKKLTSKESAGSLNSHPESSVSNEKKDFGNQVQSGELSSKVALLKQKEDSVKVENRTPRGKNIKKESASPGGETVSPKEEKTSKKTKSSPSKPTSVSPEDSDKKRINYQAYRSFLNREGPKALGSKEIPQGGENCLEGLTFVITGVLESIERDETKSLIERYGGKVTGNISKKTNYLVKGRDYGAAKCEKASVLGTKIIDEDGLFDLIRNMPGKKSKYEVAAEAEAKRAKSTPEKAEVEKRKTSPAKREGECKKKSSILEKEDTFRFSKKEPVEARRGLDFSQKSPEEKRVAQNDRNQDKERRKGGGGGEALLWVDKYKPTSLKMIIGQQGEQSCANKLLRWLQNWHRNTSEDKHVKPSKFGSKDDGSSFKAALLSGPPGVGKTTTASLVCKELGLSYVELNASDTRSKSSLKDVVAESLNNTSIKDFCSGASSSVSRNHVLIMDEVDGMAGNEDRGGIQELIDLIKHTKIPIICMCNDRNHQKMRSLVHYCFDLRFFRPRVEQIKGAMMTIAFKEGLKIPPPAMNEIILAANQDIRQVLHNLSMWCSKSKSLTYDGVKEDASKAKKDIKLGPFDVVKKVFATEEASRMSLIDKSDLFFHDYSLGPLFVQENYIHVKPAAAGGNMKKHLMLLSKAADGICDGDLVDQQIRRQQNWNLLPTQAIYSSVLPGELMRGYMHQFPSFPSWLGKFSSTGKHDRIVQELSMHMSLRTHASKRAVNLDYLPYLRDAIVNPLISLGRDGVQHAVAIMDSYYLTKEDVENIMEITTWGGNTSAFSVIDSKVKSAFTRVYNKETHLAPYSLKTVPKLKQRAGSTVDEETEVDEEQSVTEQETVENDAMIKKKSGLSSKQKPKERKK